MGLRILAAICFTILTGCTAVETIDAPRPDRVTPTDGIFSMQRGWFTMEEACAEVECREPRRVLLRMNNSEFYREEVVASPYVFDDVVYILPGEGFYVEFDRKVRQIVNLHYTPERKRVREVLYIVFAQVQDEYGRWVSSLSVDVWGADVVTFDAAAYMPGFTNPKPLVPTDYVYGDRGYNQTWQQPIVEVMLSNFRIIR